MYNPLMLFTPAALEGLLKEGYKYFIRQSYPRGITSGVKEAFILTPYKDQDNAFKHYDEIKYDRRKWLYPVDFEKHDKLSAEWMLEKLRTAASQPAGYRVFMDRLATVEWHPPKDLVLAITWYLKSVLGLRPQDVHINLTLRYGVIYLQFMSKGKVTEVLLDEIDKK